MERDVYLVDSFTFNGKGGNPAGVVFDTEGLTELQMQRIAAQVGYSETAFVLPDSECDFHVRFFTPTSEVDYCGHATLATFSELFGQGKIEAGQYSQRTKAGILTVVVSADGHIEMEQQLPVFGGELDVLEVAEALGIPAEVITNTGLPVEVISTGLADAIIPVMPGTLDDIVPDNEALADYCRERQLVGVHLFELSSWSEFTARCRNFAPLFGIPEESATGSASGALACYLAQHRPFLGYQYEFEQGRKMKRTSLISASIQQKGGTIQAVKVGGFAKHKGTQRVSLASGLTLRKMEENDRRLLCELAVSEHQSDFVLPVADTLENKTLNEDFHVICLGDNEAESTILGFFILDHSFANHPEFSQFGELGLRAYFIDARYQGKGFGRQSCQLMGDYVATHYPSVSSLVLTVNQRNTPARALYLSCGFLDSESLYLGGPAGPQHIMYLPLAA
ncbi:PhzF family phenazine biosynthesis isomerase [Photobacterium kasasachensis]|uniref:PhzF family phenazine biosynthesis isomerase n=1 Tax=Photobacterium kasasachensis TaxID=2910240 RepID=UPI003D0DB95A